MIRYLKRIFTILSILVISLFFFVLTQNHVDHNTLRIQGFYQEEKDSLDVIFVGASDVFTGYSAGLAYGEYGFTSYPYAVDANNFRFFKSQIKEVLRTQQPKCLVIETTGTSGAFTESMDDEQLAVMRQYTDIMPLSKNKIDTINEFVTKDKITYYVPAFVHCGKMNNFEDTIVKYSQSFRGYTYLKGIVTTNSKQKYDKIWNVNDDLEPKALPEKGYSIINDLLDYCETLNCKVIFTRFPHRITNGDEYDKLKQENEIVRVITSRGFDFINLDHAVKEIGLDLENDFYSDSHLNAHGQVKLTRYFSKILSEKYGVGKSELSSQNTERWNTSYEYTQLYYNYYDLHENDSAIFYLDEKPDLIKELNALK